MEGRCWEADGAAGAVVVDLVAGRVAAGREAAAAACFERPGSACATTSERTPVRPIAIATVQPVRRDTRRSPASREAPARRASRDRSSRDVSVRLVDKIVMGKIVGRRRKRSVRPR